MQVKGGLNRKNENEMNEMTKNYFLSFFAIQFTYPPTSPTLRT